MVFAQKTIQIGTIGIAQVVQPALAVVWSFLLLGERINRWQIVGIAIVMSGLLAFLVLNQRGGRISPDRGRWSERSAQRAACERTGLSRRPSGSPATTARAATERLRRSA